MKFKLLASVITLFAVLKHTGVSLCEETPPGIYQIKSATTFVPLQFDIRHNIDGMKDNEKKIDVFLLQADGLTKKGLLMFSSSRRVSNIWLTLSVGDTVVYVSSGKVINGKPRPGAMTHPVVWPNSPVIVPINFSEHVFTDLDSFKEHTQESESSNMKSKYASGFKPVTVSLLMAQFK